MSKVCAGAAKVCAAAIVLGADVREHIVRISTAASSYLCLPDCLPAAAWLLIYQITEEECAWRETPASASSAEVDHRVLW